MRRHEAIARLKSAEPDIRAFGVGTLYLFGSLARDEAVPGSDVDVFVDGETEAFYTLSNYLGVYRRLQTVFPGVVLGYSTREGLSKYIRSNAEQEAIRIF